MFHGAFSALITPFRDGAVDEAALRDLVEWQIQSGIDGLVPCGSTGESETLPRRVADLAVLQQADPGGHLQALQDDRRERRSAADRLQHSGAHRLEYPAGDLRADVRAQTGGWGQGGVGLD